MSNALGSRTRPASAPTSMIFFGASPAIVYTACARRSNTKYCPASLCWNPIGFWNDPAMCAGRAPVERRTSTRGCDDCAAVSATAETTTAILIPHDLLNGLQHVGGLREDFLLQ